MSQNIVSDRLTQENKKTNLSEEEARLLYEAAVTGLLKIKQDLEKKESPKHWFWRLFESSAGVALITVIIGGIFGTIISAKIQQDAKQNEFEQTFIKARHDQALISFKEFSERREEFIRSTLKLIGETINASNDFAHFPTSNDMPRNDEPKDIVEKKTKLYEALAIRYKTNTDNWQKEQNIISDSVAYYFPEKTEPSESFQKIQDSMVSYVKCVNSITDHPQNPCDNDKKIVEENLLALKRSFGTNRTYQWKELTDPQKTKEFLRQISEVK